MGNLPFMQNVVNISLYVFSNNENIPHMLYLTKTQIKPNLQFDIKHLAVQFPNSKTGIQCTSQT